MIDKNKKIMLLRYSGGKFYALKYLNKYIEQIKHDTYIEPFFGGGAVFWGKEKCKKNWINDLDNNLTNFLKLIKNKENLKKLLDRIDLEKTPSKYRHNEIKNFEVNNKLDDAFKYYYLNRTSFSGKMNNPHWGFRPIRSLPIERWKERLIPCSKKLQNVKITNIDFEDILIKNKDEKNTLIYLDPPYFSPNKKNHYKFFFEKNDHYRLNNILSKLKTPFILSYDDNDEIRKMYKKFNINEIKFYYRVSNSKNDNDKRLKKIELVITNF